MRPIGLSLDLYLFVLGIQRVPAGLILHHLNARILQSFSNEALVEDLFRPLLINK